MGVLTGAGVRILLVGAGRHTAGSELPGLPTVSATVTDLATTLVERCGHNPTRYARCSTQQAHWCSAER